MKRFALLSLLLLSACTHLSLEARKDAANEIAAGAGMAPEIVQAGMFNLSVWSRITQPGAPADVYIEGDGLAYLDKYTPSLNPTPPEPQALELASKDTAPNVIYIARPCQYSGVVTPDTACPQLYWTSGRTAPEVLEAFTAALDTLKTKHNISGFNLTGYSGGAAVAVLTASTRTDVLSLRTVAGNTDYDAFTTLHRLSPMKGSVDPVSVAPKLARVPQIHFIGDEDKVVQPAVFEGWKTASSNSTCVQSVIVPDVSHEKGWTETWATLLAQTPVCR